jgi:small subunit ribosomal protein S1
MSNPVTPDSGSTKSSAVGDPDESFKDILSQFEQSQSPRSEGGKGREGTVIAVTIDSVLVDIGFKTEGFLPLAAFASAGKTVTAGDKLVVSIKGRDPEGYYELALGRIDQPKDWASLQKAFADKATIVGTVTGVVKGGLTVDVGVRAFLPASRSGTRDAAEMQKLVDQEIRCRITKLDETEEDVVVDRRVVAEEEERARQDRRYSEIKEGETVRGTVRSLTDFGAFVTIGGVDALLHVSDISRARVNKPADVLSVGQEIEVRVLKIDPEKRRISVGMKQLEADPWETVSAKYQPGNRARGTVMRVLDFGAFVEIEAGIEGLIHVSEMSWGKKLKSASTVVKPGEIVDVVILGVSSSERRISLGLKQAMGDPWADAAERFAPGAVVEGPVVSITRFGAFVQLVEGVEGMIHISEMSSEKHLNHPQELLKLGQTVNAKVLAVDSEKRQLRLSMKQLLPSGLDEYIAEHKEGDVVTGRVVEVSGGNANVELGESIHSQCSLTSTGSENEAKSEPEPHLSRADLSSLGSMLQARWKSGTTAGGSKRQALAAGQIRKFRIAKLDSATKKIELELL